MIFFLSLRERIKERGRKLVLIYASIITKAKNFRQHHTPAELLLWMYIRNKQLNGVKFKRQVPIGKYIVDFASLKNKLIIEIDGGHHNDESYKSKDNERTKQLELRGYKVIRIWNNE